jgi:hypothetical protein
MNLEEAVIRFLKDNPDGRNEKQMMLELGIGMTRLKKTLKYMQDRSIITNINVGRSIVWISDQ